MSLKHSYSDFIFDVSDVLTTWPADLTYPIERKALRACLVCRTWYQYECGRIGQDECFQLLSKQFSRDAAVFEDAWTQVRRALRPNEEMIALIKELKASSGGKARIYGTLNVSRPDYAYFRSRTDLDFALFDAVFVSHELDTRLPHPGFFRRVIARPDARFDPADTVYVGHDADDVVTARTFGMHGVLLANLAQARRELRNIVGDPVHRGWAYLRANAGKLVCDADRPGVSIMENFGQLLILEATGDRSLVSLTEPPRYWNYFQGKGILTHEDFPDDLDTTSLGLVTMNPPKEHVHSIMDEMLTCLSEDGLPYTYFDKELPRLDPVVAVNVLHLFYTHGRGSELPGALSFVRAFLTHRAYAAGTRYYFREGVLYFVSRLLAAAPDDAALHAALGDLLRARVQELVGAPGDALALALRVVTCANVGVRNEVDMRSLLPLQCEDGGWEIGYVYRYGISGMKIGSRGYTTAMAIKAITLLEELRAKELEGAT